jgi:hypothetical protein
MRNENNTTVKYQAIDKNKEEIAVFENYDSILDDILTDKQVKYFTGKRIEYRERRGKAAYDKMLQIYQHKTALWKDRQSFERVSLEEIEKQTGIKLTQKEKFDGTEYANDHLGGVFCENCTNCHNCFNCKNCKDCNLCENCDYLINMANAKDISGIVRVGYAQCGNSNDIYIKNFDKTIEKRIQVYDIALRKDLYEHNLGKKNKNKFFLTNAFANDSTGREYDVIMPLSIHFPSKKFDNLLKNNANAIAAEFIIDFGKKLDFHHKGEVRIGNTIISESKENEYAKLRMLSKNNVHPIKDTPNITVGYTVPLPTLSNNYTLLEENRKGNWRVMKINEGTGRSLTIMDYAQTMSSEIVNDKNLKLAIMQNKPIVVGAILGMAHENNPAHKNQRWNTLDNVINVSVLSLVQQVKAIGDETKYGKIELFPKIIEAVEKAAAIKYGKKDFSLVNVDDWQKYKTKDNEKKMAMQMENNIEKVENTARKKGGMKI